MSRSILLLSLASLLGTGCISESLRTSRQADLRKRAAFDLGCPADKLELSPLDDAASSHGGGTTGVRGCDKQATYVWEAHQGMFVMDASAKPADAAAPAPAPAP